MKTLPWLLVGMLLVVAFWGWLRPVDTAPEENREKDTATFVDTIPYFVPVPRDSVVVKYVIARLPSAVDDSVGSHAVDTVHRSDSVAVAIPITQKSMKTVPTEPMCRGIVRDSTVCFSFRGRRLSPFGRNPAGGISESEPVMALPREVSSHSSG